MYLRAIDEALCTKQLEANRLNQPHKNGEHNKAK